MPRQKSQRAKEKQQQQQNPNKNPTTTFFFSFGFWEAVLRGRGKTMAYLPKVSSPQGV